VSESTTRRNIELLATAVGVGAVLLPVGGIVVRSVAFWSLSADNSRQIVLGDSLGSLAVTGFEAVLLSLPYLIVLLLSLRGAPLLQQLRIVRPRANRLSRDSDAIQADAKRFQADLDAAEKQAESGNLPKEEVDRLRAHAWDAAAKALEFSKAVDEFSASQEWKRLSEVADDVWMPGSKYLDRFFRRVPPWVADVVFAIAIAAVVVFSYSWPVAIPFGAGWFAVGIAWPWLAMRRNVFQFTGVAALAALAVLLSAVGAGLGGLNGSQYLADYDFKTDANLPAGRYVHLAESNGFLVLESCASHRVVAVDQGSVAHITESARPDRPPRPNLWEVAILNRKPIIGYRSDC
jgi:hypothetical protein